MVMASDSSIKGHLIFWAKVGADADGRQTFHPLLCHMIDVAAVARAMWEVVLSPAARSRIATTLAIEESEAGWWVGFWAGLHDLGKLCPAFQLQDAAARARIQEAGFHCPTFPVSGAHGTVTAYSLPAILQADFGVSRQLASGVATAIGGHHGVFPGAFDVNNLTADAVGRGRWEAERRAFVQLLAGILGVPRDARPQEIDNATAMALAGLVSVADWIGSNTDYFCYAVQDASAALTIDLHRYAQKAEQGARRALKCLGWTGWSPRGDRRSFLDLFDLTEARPVQEAVVSLTEVLGSPSLVLIEAPMGEGKTEAAMYLADHWGTSFGQRGCYFALPTQATSNQMFGRVRRFLVNRYREDVVNLQLLHGHAALSSEFEDLRRRGDQLFQPEQVYDQDGRGAVQPGVVAAEWFTHRKRGLLAPFGVGTVDQGLLAVLQTRHVFVRLFGLAQKTVIVDEIHAYDTYMSALLERLLEWLAALGSSVVLLSATLPRGRRCALVEAYARGLGSPVAEPGAEVPYPRLTWATATVVGTRHVGTSSRSAKAVRLELVDGGLPARAGEPFELGERLRDALTNGGCAAVICNTVGRAQRVYRALEPYFQAQADDGWPELDLLHARYLFEEREQRDRRALVRFGKPGGEVEVGGGERRPVRRPWRAVLVATQIIEQSLDLDFDLMVTDVAPGDLVLQRAGRLHRHEWARPPGLERRTLWLCRPEEERDGVPRFDRGTEAVYDHHALLRSWLQLRHREAVRIPEDVEALIEAVYDDRPCPEGAGEPVRARWEETRRRHEEQVVADEQEAMDRWLKPPTYSGALWRLMGEPREEDTPDFHQAHQALTRLAEPTVQVVSLFGTRERPSFDADGQDTINPAGVPTVALAKRLLRRSVGVSDRRVVFSLLADEPPSGWRRSPLLRHHRLLVLDAAGGAMVGDYRVRLDAEEGLVISSVGEEAG